MIHEVGSAAQPSDASSMSDDSSIIMSDPDDNAGFTLVKSKRIRKRKHVSKESASSDDTIITTPSPGLTVVVKPADPSQIITKVNPLKLSEKLNDIAPDGVILIRPNYRLNLLEIDTRNTESKKTLLKMTTLCGMKITVYEAHQRSSAIGIIRGVSQEITEADLQDTTVLTVIAAYIEPRARFDKDILDELIKATPKLTHFVRSHYIARLEHSYSMSITLRGNLVEYQKSGRLHDHGKNDTVTTRMGPREQKDTSYMHVRIPPRKEQCRQCFRSSIHR
ncbi:hypothetical protein HPB47_013507 [Ixodes persulcatus]|uniref:Uncharacterized protein n=1 Tax=Ixodes persulcatus TaxID=34615 RepID=A0AC60R1S0_IXOPE|nr:hypothetical protein HPB47_013507 [Ixodes persulcatus]